VNDTKKIAKNISTKDIVTIYQLRKIFNVYKTWENRLKNQWSNIEDEYYKFYPKLAYMTGRGLISNEFFKLLIHCMDVVDNGDNKENVLKFKNFIKYYEAIISYYTYQNLKKGNKEIM
jgi:CRISPR type III-A-associated protein Csm2